MCVSSSYYYSAGYRYAVLNATDALKLRKNAVFHRITAGDKTACNGTVVLGDEVTRAAPDMRPCKRCFVNKVAPRRPRATLKQAVDLVVSVHGDTLRELGSK